MGCILASVFYRFWLILGAVLGRKIEQISRKNRIEKQLKKEGQQDGQQDAPRAYEGARDPWAGPRERSPPLRRDNPLVAPEIRRSLLLASKVLYSTLQYLKVL